ncbi:MAG TPA: hypothetical protein VF763_01010 [Candidatus Limnocylindrales bacterium]
MRAFLRPATRSTPPNTIGWTVDRAGPDWRDDPRTVRPVVLVLGGFLTSPPIYRPFRRRLLERGAADVVVAPVWLPDWLLAASRGLGPIVSRGARGLLAAGIAAAASRESRAAPVLVVGHSAGGVVGRLLLAPEPFDGRPCRAAGRIGALVTLGSPLRPGPRFLGRAGTAAARFAETVSPGAFHAPLVGYLSVSSRSVVGRAAGDGQERMAWRVYRGLVPEPMAGPIEGDGLVPVQSALLPGARQLVLDDAAHGQGAGRPWYGVEPELDHWWPLALETWHEALEARMAARPLPRSA